MSVSGHKSVESLKIYKCVTGNEKFMMGYTLGYALQNPNDIPPTPEIEDPSQLKAIMPPIPSPQQRPTKKLKALPTTQATPASLH